MEEKFCEDEEGTQTRHTWVWTYEGETNQDSSVAMGLNERDNTEI